ncbi:putative membrane protein [Clostridioides difficile CD160]|nr:putative membrane protein [Clostridioides difficile CD160]
MFIGNINGNLLYIFIPIIFLLTNSNALSIISGKNLINAVIENKVGDRMGNLAFDVPVEFLISRIVLGVIGSILILSVCKAYNKSKA